MDEQQPPDAALAQAYVAHKMAGLSDLDAALKARDSLRQNAEARSSFRNAQDLAVGLGKTPLTGDSLRTQLMGEADQPIKDAQMRAQAGYAQALADPSHPANRVLQAQLARAMPNTPPEAFAHLTVGHMETLGPQMKEIAEQAKSMADAGKSGADATHTTELTRPDVAAKQAEAAKTEAEAKRIADLVNAEKAEKLANARKTGNEAAVIVAGLGSAGPAAAAAVKLKEAEAREKGAAAGKIEQETGGTVATGPNGEAWKVRGDIGVDQKARDEFKNQVSAANKSSALVDQLLQHLGNSSYIANPERTARAAVLSKQLLLASKEAAGIRGLPDKDVQFLEGLTGDFSAMNWRNLTGYAHNPERLQQLKDSINRGLEIDANARGIVRQGGAAAPKAGGAPVTMKGKNGKTYAWGPHGWEPG